jgi:hypothetical protein
MWSAIGLRRLDHGALFIVHFVGRQYGNACHAYTPCFYLLCSAAMTSIAAVAITTIVDPPIAHKPEAKAA